MQWGVLQDFFDGKLIVIDIYFDGMAFNVSYNDEEMICKISTRPEARAKAVELANEKYN